MLDTRGASCVLRRARDERPATSDERRRTSLLTFMKYSTEQIKSGKL